jgi:Tfp pilus assembly protein PilF
MALYQSLLDRNLFPTLARNNLAYLLAESQPTPENLERALNLASEALEDQPEDPNLLDTMGWVLCKQGNFAKAKTYLEQALEKAPDHPTLLYHQGWCLEKLGEPGKARELLAKAVAAKGEFPERAAADKLLKSLSAGGKP